MPPSLSLLVDYLGDDMKNIMIARWSSRSDQSTDYHEYARNIEFTDISEASTHRLGRVLLAHTPYRVSIGRVVIFLHYDIGE